MITATHSEQYVLVVDDDPGVRDSLDMLLDSVELPHRMYSCASELLNEIDDIQGGCLVLDIRMPGMSGLELQEVLRQRGVTLPIIFITGHGDISMAVKAMRLGALDFVTKPFREQALLDRIHEALNRDEQARGFMADQRNLRSRIDSLTERERQVFECVTDGLANKVIAHDLGVSERTVEVHRSQVMRKLGARSLAKIVRMRIESERPPCEPDGRPRESTFSTIA